MFKENAGHVRGFRISRDPQGILFSSFDYAGTQMGYVLTYGEGVPAIHDGTDWVVVLTDEAASTFEDDLQGLLVKQANVIATAMDEPVYAELGAQMGMYAQVQAASTDPSTTAKLFGS